MMPLLPAISDLLSMDLDFVREDFECHDSFAEFADDNITGLHMMDSECLEDEKISMKICGHPLWPQLLNAYFACRQVSATDPDETASIRHERDEVEARAREILPGVQQVVGADPDLDAFLADYIRELESMYSTMEQLVTTTESICSATEGHLANLARPPQALSKPQRPNSSSFDSDEAFRMHLKRSHAASILSLKEEFMRKKKKGKLDPQATVLLKTWWTAHVVWPYPTEVDKLELCETTGLSATQINNWFINQRKRHWHKLFRSKPPSSEEESKVALIQTYGSINAAEAALNKP